MFSGGKKWEYWPEVGQYQKTNSFFIINYCNTIIKLEGRGDIISKRMPNANTRSSNPKVFCKSALKNFAKLPRKHLRQRLFYACHFIKRVSGIGVFYRKRLLLKHSLNRKKNKKQTFQEIHFDEWVIFKKQASVEHKSIACVKKSHRHVNVTIKQHNFLAQCTNQNF